jgi:hypothetical protein
MINTNLKQQSEHILWPMSSNHAVHTNWWIDSCGVGLSRPNNSFKTYLKSCYETLTEPSLYYLCIASLLERSCRFRWMNKLWSKLEIDLRNERCYSFWEGKLKVLVLNQQTRLNIFHWTYVYRVFGPNIPVIKTVP